MDELYDAVKELLSHLEVEDCGYCDGRGEQRGNPHDACRECGGIGEIVRGTILPEEVRRLNLLTRGAENPRESHE